MKPVRNKARYIVPALALPFATCGLQWLFWDAFRPFVWFLFYPTVYFSSRVGGKRVGIVSTVVSALLVVYFFIPPQLSFSDKPLNNLFSVVVFLIMGVLFSYTHDRLEQSRHREAKAMAAARTAEEQLQEARIGRLEAEKRLAEESLHQSEEMYRSLFSNMLNGFAYCKVLFDGDVPQDFIYLSVNSAFEKQTGLKDVAGRRVTEVIPGIKESDPGIFEIYGRVALTGQPEQFEVYVAALQQWFWVSVYSPAREHFVAVFDVITARKQAEKEIHLLNADLEQRVTERTAEMLAANRELDAFAYAVSHDLRAPLRAMIGFSQAVIDDYGQQLEDGARDYLEEIQLASRNMGKLIDGLLTLSRSSRGEIDCERLDLGAMACRIRSELERTEPERRVEWQISEEVPVSGDSRMLEIVMQNLLANAWKYTAKTPAAQIRFFPEERDGQRYFCISDNGAGFDMRHADRLFKPFQRLHRQDEFTGIGIGLATVQRIIDRHGGSIEAEGEPGKGALFRFTLNTATV